MTTGSRRGVLVGVTAFVLSAGISLVSLVYRPIESTVVLGLCGLVLVVLAARSPRASVGRLTCAGATLGILVVLAFYWGSALVNLEPDVVIDRG